MTKGNKIFKILMCVLLGITMLWTAYISYAFIYYATEEKTEEVYALYVGGIQVTSANANDILGNGTVSYDAKANKLILKNATIEYNYTLIYSEIDLLIELVGENKLIFKDNASGTAIYASNGILRKDLSLDGDGTLDIAFENTSEGGTGIVADDLWIGSNITVTTPDGSNISNGLVCTSSLILRNKAQVTVNNGAARSSTAVSVRGDAIIESGSSLTVTVNPGSTDACNGVCISGNLTTGKDTSLNVTVDDDTAESNACINVLGVINVGKDSTVTASAQKSYGIMCSGAIEASNGATITASTEKKGADIFCCGALVNYGADINAEIDSLGGIHNREGD